MYGLGILCREALGGDVPAELAPVLDAAVATDPDERPSSASELARLLRAAVPQSSVRLPRPGVTTGRTFDTPTRMFGPRPPVPSVRRARGRNRFLRVVPAVVVVAAIVLLSGRTAGHGAARLATQHTAAVPCAGDPIPIPPKAQLVRGDTSGVGCLTAGVYSNQVLTIRVRPADPSPRRFALGLPGDQIYLGDWDCDGVATPALVRPSTNTTLYYESWSANAKPALDASRCRSIG